MPEYLYCSCGAACTPGEYARHYKDLGHDQGEFNRRSGVSYATEKDAINAARKLRIDEIDRLQKEVNLLDGRFDALEDIEMAAEVAKTTHLDSNPIAPGLK